MLDVETLQMGNPNININDIEDLRREIISLSGVPSSYLGYQDVADLREVSMADLFASEHREPFREVLRATWGGAPYEQLRVRYPRSDGQDVWLDVHATRVGDAIYTTMRNVSGEVDALTTAREHLEKLERSEAFYRGLVDQQNAFIVRIAPNGTLTFVNEAFCRLFGGSREAWIGRSITPLLHEEDLGEALEALDALRDEPLNRGGLTTRVNTPSGTRWVAWEAMAHVSEDGSLQEVQASGRDVTELMEVEHELRDAHRSLELATEMAKIGRWDLDHVQNTLRWSSGVYDLFGVDRATFTPTFDAFLGMVHEDDRANVAEAYQAALEAKRPYDVEHRIVTPAGEVKWLREVCEIDFGPNGEPLHSTGVVQDVSYRKLHDSLTGLPNALQLDDTIAERMEDSRRSGRGFALAVMDVDYFAQLNVSVGRANADRALVTLADRLRDNAGDQDVVARVGGDEFAVLLDDVRDELDARNRLMRLLEVVQRPLRLANRDETLSLSIGVTLFPHDTDEPDTLRRQAVHALQLAKNQGRGMIVAFDDTVKEDEAAVATRRLRIRDAMQHGEFTVFVQPSVRFDDGALCGVESLVRWRHPEDGIRPPSGFLPDMLGSELELLLGRWMLDESLSLWSTWRRERVPHADIANVSVNIGAHQLLTPGFVEDVRDALARHPDVPPSEVQVEVLETAALADVEHARSVLRRIRGLGVRIALDDFGTGYSSLAYFRNLPTDVLKIDRSFVSGMLSNGDDLGIVQSIIALARAFDRQVVAEGVETMKHAAVLHALGADVGQGYAISKPMPADAYLAWSEAWTANREFDHLEDHMLGPIEELPLRVALRSHDTWFDVLDEASVQRDMPPAMALDHHACPFGAWLHGTGSANYGHLPAFDAVVAEHEAFHTAADRLVDALRRGGNVNEGEGASLHAAFREAHERLRRQMSRLMTD